MTDQNLKVPHSMIELYGKEEAPKVLQRCYEVDPFFGEWVSKYIYDILWEMPPLSLLNKSLITVVSLIVLEKEEQLTIHLKGIFNLGKNADFIAALIHYLKIENHIESGEKSLEILKQATSQLAPLPKITNTENNSSLYQNVLSEKEKALIDLSAFVALGNNKKTKSYLENLLSKNILTQEEIDAVFRHQMTYCGCPCTMNAFALTKQIQNATS